MAPTTGPATLVVSVVGAVFASSWWARSPETNSVSPLPVDSLELEKQATFEPSPGDAGDGHLPIEKLLPLVAFVGILTYQLFLRKKPRSVHAAVEQKETSSANVDVAEPSKPDLQCDAALVAKVPSPSRSPKSKTSARRLSGEQALANTQLEEESLDGRGLNDIEHADRLLKQKWITSDAGAFVIFEEASDELQHHKRRSRALDCFVRAFGKLQKVREDNDRLREAGSELLDDCERLQKENRELAGDVAYWREMAEGSASAQEVLKMAMMLPRQFLNVAMMLRYRHSTDVPEETMAVAKPFRPPPGLEHMAGGQPARAKNQRRSY